MHGIRLLSTSLLALYAAAGARATAANDLFDSVPLDDAELAQARGGFTLPNGVTIDFGVIMSTVVNGARVLQTELRVMGDTITTNVVQAVGTQAKSATDAAKDSITVPIVDATDGGSASATGTATQSSPMPDISAAAGTGASVDAGGVSANAAPGGSASVNAGGGVVADVSSGGANGSGLSLSPNGVQVTVGSVTVSTDAGGTPQVSVAGTGGGAAGQAAGQAASAAGYTLTTGTATDTSSGVSASAILPQLLIEHEIGRSISSRIINTGDGQVIDNRLVIDLSIGNVQPYSIGSIGYRVQSLGLDAAMWRGSGG